VIASKSKQSFLISIALIAVSFLAYYRTLYYGFVEFDDPVYITRNDHLLHGFGMSQLIWAFTSNYASNWHPITWLSHLLDIQLFGLNPFGHHAVNLFFHAANAALVFLVLNRFTQDQLKSAAVALLFAVHPLHVESVAWISERKDVLSTFFGLWSLYFYFSYAQTKSLRHYLLVAWFFVLSLMSKPMLVTLPGLLFLLDYWPLKRFTLEQGSKKNRKSLWDVCEGLFFEKIPLLALSFASAAITYQAQNRALVFRYDLMMRLGNVIRNYGVYLYKSFIPHPLLIMYPFNFKDIPLAPVLISLASLFFITVFVVSMSKKSPDRGYLILGWFWFLISLVPVIGWVPIGWSYVSDRYMYLPIIGIFVLLVWSGSEVLKKVPVKFVGVGAIILIACGFAFKTEVQIGYWQSTEKLFEHALKHNPKNMIAYHKLAELKEDQGDTEEALKIYRQIEKSDPEFPGVHVSIGNYHFRHNDYPNAILQYQQAARLDPNLSMAYTNLGAALYLTGRTDEGIAAFKKALELNPADEKAARNLAQAQKSQSSSPAQPPPRS